MTDYAAALKKVELEAGAALATCHLPLAEALGKTLACDIHSPIALPGFRNSAMDGFAVDSRRLQGAAPSSPVVLPLEGAIAAGDVVVTTAAPDQAVPRIMTGALVPKVYDAVVAVEDAEVREGQVYFVKPVRPGENLRQPGEDVVARDMVLRRGQCLTPARLMLLAALGMAVVEVHRLPPLYVFSTGRELVEVGAALGPGQIYNSNAPYLLAEAAAAGLEGHYQGIVADDRQHFEQALAAVPPGSLVVSSGAVSKGEWDFIPESLKRLGAITHFHRVNIRPGKPLLFATLGNGSVFFGLPGNPISAAIGWHFFIRPALCALQGRAVPVSLIATLQTPFSKKNKLRQFLKARLAWDAPGVLQVSILPGQESFRILPFAYANAWVVLPEAARDYGVGERVEAFPFSEFSND